MRRAGDGFGVRVKRNEGYTGMDTVQVEIIHPEGALARHNASSVQRAVEVSDIIISVNGVQGDWRRLLAEFKSAESISMVVERPSQPPSPRKVRYAPDFSLGATSLETEDLLETLSDSPARTPMMLDSKQKRWAVTLWKSKGEKMGARLRQRTLFTGELVAEIELIEAGGALDTYNQKYPETALQEGDAIFSANDAHGDWGAMVSEFAKELVVMKVYRGARRKAHFSLNVI